MGWVLRKFSWVFVRTFGISGAEAVVAAASPFIGQGKCLILHPVLFADIPIGENVLLTKVRRRHCRLSAVSNICSLTSSISPMPRCTSQ
jgi:hypothetical protein